MILIDDRLNGNWYEYFQLAITAWDNGYPTKLSTTTILELNVRKVSQYPPEFPIKEVQLRFTGKWDYLLERIDCIYWYYKHRVLWFDYETR